MVVKATIAVMYLMVTAPDLLCYVIRQNSFVSISFVVLLFLCVAALYYGVFLEEVLILIKMNSVNVFGMASDVVVSLLLLVCGHESRVGETFRCVKVFYTIAFVRI